MVSDGRFKKGHTSWNKGLARSNDYRQIHKWIRRNFGSASKCENPDCKGNSEFFDWAKLPGRNYTQNRDNYIQLCRKCHKLMDYYKRPLSLA